MNIYLAGPIDYDPERPNHLQGWQHDIMDSICGAAEFWCPVCQAAGKTDEQIWVDNMDALHSADFVIAYFGTTPTFGTPIEVWMAGLDRTATALIHPGTPGLFVRMLEKGGLSVLRDVEEAKSWLVSQNSSRG